MHDELIILIRLSSCHWASVKRFFVAVVVLDKYLIVFCAVIFEVPGRKRVSSVEAPLPYYSNSTLHVVP